MAALSVILKDVDVLIDAVLDLFPARKVCFQLAILCADVRVRGDVHLLLHSSCQAHTVWYRPWRPRPRAASSVLKRQLAPSEARMLSISTYGGALSGVH